MFFIDSLLYVLFSPAFSLWIALFVFAISLYVQIFDFNYLVEESNEIRSLHNIVHVLNWLYHTFLAKWCSMAREQTTTTIKKWWIWKKEKIALQWEWGRGNTLEMNTIRAIEFNLQENSISCHTFQVWNVNGVCAFWMRPMYLMSILLIALNIFHFPTRFFCNGKVKCINSKIHH